jgi:predicted MFS family arabinose efflux permease
MNTTATWKLAGRKQSQPAGRNARLYVSFALVGYNITAFGLGGALGPWLGGLLFDLTGHYTIAFWLALAATFISTIGVFAIGSKSGSGNLSKTSRGG